MLLHKRVFGPVVMGANTIALFEFVHHTQAGPCFVKHRQEKFSIVTLPGHYSFWFYPYTQYFPCAIKNHRHIIRMGYQLDHRRLPGHGSWAPFHGSAYRKHRIGAYGSREVCAYGKRISRVSGEFWLLRVRTSRY